MTYSLWWLSLRVLDMTLSQSSNARMHFKQCCEREWQVAITETDVAGAAKNHTDCICFSKTLPACSTLVALVFGKFYKSMVSCDCRDRMLALTMHAEQAPVQLDEEALHCNWMMILECERYKAARPCPLYPERTVGSRKSVNNSWTINTNTAVDNGFQACNVRRPVACVHKNNVFYNLQGIKDDDQKHKCTSDLACTLA